MTEETTGAPEAPAAAAPTAPAMQVLAQFIRDLSFENIVAQKGITSASQPDVQVQVNLDAKKRTVDKQFEVSMKLKITSNVKESGEPMFLMELDYGGIFHIDNVPEDQLHPFLLIECPRMLFPYVRRIVGDVTRDGGFPPLNLETIDFLALYRAELTRRAQAEAAASPAPVS
ncbi:MULTISPECIES: protein-export chaperone SecB [Falsihalocynthiibacter]|uniref:Protein-export protein SecB n=1 Tax=Falsihalocynthiibacter arcticus TaxID=1579316 RepID=A0A126UXR8_9RHOB|nr:protein-export chaperone SecB [Falsihalocynthiibacter arcticus]AML50863.1 preprotein translocase subunit SecB [Falsihalocynthiibacter arcticus]